MVRKAADVTEHVGADKGGVALLVEVHTVLEIGNLFGFFRNGVEGVDGGLQLVGGHGLEGEGPPITPLIHYAADIQVVARCHGHCRVTDVEPVKNERPEFAFRVGP